MLIGDGSMRKALEKETKELGIADVVKFLGNISNDKVNRYLQASDVFLFASKSETQGMALEKETKELGIADVVKFLGNISNDKVNRYLQASDVFLFASKSETQGIVLAEAFAAGCPIVAVDASGVEDIVENGQNGFVTEENAEVWSNRVTDVLGQLVRMKQQAKITAEGYRSEDIVENGQNGFVTEENAEVWSNRVTDVLGQLVRMKQQAKITAEGYRSERLAVYEESLYERVISEKNAGRQEELGYEYEEHGAKSPSERVFSL